MQVISGPHSGVKTKHVQSLSSKPPVAYNNKWGEKVIGKEKGLGTSLITIQLCVDKLILCFALGDADHRASIIGDLKVKPEHLWARGIKTGWNTPKKCELEFHARNPSGHILGPWHPDAFAHLTLRPSNPVFGRLEWAPSHWTRDQVDSLSTELERVLLIGEPWIPNVRLGDVLRTASVSRIDVAADVQGIRPTDYHWQSAHKSGATLSASGQVETIYLGKLKGQEAKFCIYDKQVESNLEHPLTRIEHRKRTPNIHAGKLETYPNPFRLLGCFNVLKAISAPSMAPEVWHKAFADSITLRGLDAALDGLDCPTLATKLGSAIKACTPLWWKPATLWQDQWPRALHDALPFMFSYPDAPKLIPDETACSGLVAAPCGC